MSLLSVNTWNFGNDIKKKNYILHQSTNTKCFWKISYWGSNFSLLCSSKWLQICEKLNVNQQNVTVHYPLKSGISNLPTAKIREINIIHSFIKCIIITIFMYTEISVTWWPLKDVASGSQVEEGCQLWLWNDNKLRWTNIPKLICKHSCFLNKSVKL